jgi:hypothetical protein
MLVHIICSSRCCKPWATERKRVNWNGAITTFMVQKKRHYNSLILKYTIIIRPLFEIHHALRMIQLWTQLQDGNIIWYFRTYRNVPCLFLLPPSLSCMFQWRPWSSPMPTTALIFSTSVHLGAPPRRSLAKGPDGQELAHESAVPHRERPLPLCRGWGGARVLDLGQHVSHTITRPRAAPWSRASRLHSGRATKHAYARHSPATGLEPPSSTPALATPQRPSLSQNLLIMMAHKYTSLP